MAANDWAFEKAAFYTTPPVSHQGKTLQASYYQFNRYTAHMGCHTKAITYLGYLTVIGVRWGYAQDGELKSGETPQATHYHPNPKLQGEGLDPQIVQDVVYKNVIESWATSGIIIFSDRINRGTENSKYQYPPSYGGLKYNCAQLAKWLTKHPELGTITGSPIINNPNYTIEGNYGLCQVFTFVPARIAVFTDESVGVPGPDIMLPKEDFYEKVKKQNPQITTEAKIKQFLQVTYD